MNQTCSQIIEGLLDEVKKSLITDGESAYIVDPVYGIVRNRVNAEICKALLRMGDQNIVPGLIAFIVKHQNPDGSWNEVHPQYNQPSALITSFIGDALVSSYALCPYEESLKKARDYVLAHEMKPGYYLKSAHYNADHLNVDASCGAFLAVYGDLFSDQECLDAAHRAAERVCRYQYPDGSYPYTSDQGSYQYSLNIPCIHYQGVTMYYLSKINAVLKEEWIDESLLNGADWLALKQQPDGSFDWSASGLMFAYYLSGAYAFAYSSFTYAGRLDPKYLKNARLSLKGLEKNTHGIMLRWETDSWGSFISSPIKCLKTANIGNFPLKEKAFRFGYGMYRQIARRRYSEFVDPRVFHLLCSLLGIKASTVEASNNYQDLFMTSEVLDCLSYSMSMETGV